MMSTDLHRLATQVEALKEASMFDAKERADAVLDTAKRLMMDFDRRLARVEKLYENVEPHR